MATLLIIFASIFVLGPIAKAYAERVSRGYPAETLTDRSDLLRLKEEVDRLTVEVARLQDEQSFMVKLLNDGERRTLAEGRQNKE